MIGWLKLFGLLAGLVAIGSAIAAPFVLVRNSATRAARAEHSAEAAKAETRQAQAQTQITTKALDESERTHGVERSTRQAADHAIAEIHHASDQIDPHAQYVAWSAGVERVWRDAGFESVPLGDPGAGRAPREPGAVGDAGGNGAPGFVA